MIFSYKDNKKIVKNDVKDVEIMNWKGFRCGYWIYIVLFLKGYMKWSIEIIRKILYVN